MKPYISAPRYRPWVACAALVVLVLILFVWAPTNYAFYYSDAPRHALNGAFILDLVKAFPIHDPVQWAYNYYAQYPALTILFYPPLYPAVLAVAYAILGVSQASAVVVNALFYTALLIGSYRLACRYVDRIPAFFVAFLIGAAPEMAFWGRQIMTDVPATAAAVWAMELLLAYAVSHDRRVLWLGAAIAVVAVWLKITVCFLLPVLALGLVQIDGWAVWRRPRNLVMGCGVVLLMLPLLWLTIHFGQTNVQSVTGVADGATPRSSLSNWLWYARSLPLQLGWPVTAAVALGAVAGVVRVVRSRHLPAHWGLLAAWVVVGYLFFSTIDLKDPRFTIPLLPPFVLIGVWGVCWLFGARARWAGLLLAAIGAATLITTLVYRPPLYVSGYAHIVKDVARLAPENSNVVFSGYRDGAFIFAMRAIGHRPDVDTIRADKMLLSIAIRRSTGVREKHLTRAQIGQELTRQKAAYVVAQDDFWTDLTEMRRLQWVLHSPQFTPVAHYRMHANFNAPEKTITVYRNNAPLPAKRPPRSIDLPAIDRTVTQGKG
ncbi:ArnT family glycosyltransferase [Salinisphaera hydrothermalis]|uniref:4-amino-4-deoxy-L-arabinose transferase-like protein n=1 Tax=Salinisphaera hydrothermalis (strain C41B8) TaxID=1304275 RepID=A0A084IME3_SALHC|nr:glycosyltransferase family 39 protein [Salinisphaera hydrothermalis]KEZ77877.1 4-amino-4-deoxy-L-arabinose transferase-like protein [Salinisphaera hydrothermalis C41B8]